MPLNSFITELSFAQSFLDGKRREADPEADAVIRQLVEEQGEYEAKKLFDILIRNVDLPITKLPDSVRRFISTHGKLPVWADTKKIRKAQALFVDHGPKLLLFLYFKSLPTLYACEKGAKVLIRTGKLAHKQDDMVVFSRRIAETGQFLLNIMAPGNFKQGKKGINTILKVRLIHASIRHFVKAHHWDVDTLGEPINQEDLGITLTTFSYSLMDGLDRFGIRESPDKIEAFIHLWACVGHILGIDEDMLPGSFAESKLLHNLILDRQKGASKEGKLLTKALVLFAEKHLPLKEMVRLPQLMIIYLTSPEIASMLGVRLKFGFLYAIVPDFIKKLFNWAERLEERSGRLSDLIDLVSVRLTKRMVEYFNEFKQVPFEIPKSLKDEWKFLDA